MATAGGGALATTEFRVLLIEFLDYACTLSPRSILTVYVDDMTVEATARERDIVEIIAVVFRYLLSVIKQLRMRLSDSKCVCCASSFRVGRSLAGSVPGLVMRFAIRPSGDVTWICARRRCTAQHDGRARVSKISAPARCAFGVCVPQESTFHA